MKTKTLFSLVVAVLFTSNVFASANQSKIFQNQTPTEFGLTKEYIILDSETNIAYRKVVYKYNLQGVITERIAYKWDAKKGWLGFYKFEYTMCDNSKLVSEMKYTKWDTKKNNWSSASEIFAYNKQSAENQLAISHTIGTERIQISADLSIEMHLNKIK